MKHIALLSAGVAALLLASCRENAAPTVGPAGAGLELELAPDPSLDHENLRLYPIVADPAVLRANAAVPGLKTLAEAMETPGFRLTERKSFGREQGSAVNALTVQNRSADTIFLMSGDVVTGGNQDRVIARDEIVMPASLRNIEVFCVEKGRWTYYDSTAEPAARELGAFRGYFSVASPSVRRAVQRSGRQEEVWSAVAAVTAAHDAASATATYAALDAAESEQRRRSEACLKFFEGKWDDRPDVVGVVAVSGSRVLGVDIFGHPDLFRRQFPALLHGYAADAVV
jgi:hypothetical protein